MSLPLPALSLQSAQAALCCLIQSHPSAVIQWDSNGTIVDWNPAAEAIFGYTKLEVIGQRGAQRFVPEFCPFLAAGSSQSPVDRSYQVLTRAGQYLECEWRTLPLLDANEQTIGMLSIVQSVVTCRSNAERQEDCSQAEQEMQRTEQRLRKHTQILRQLMQDKTLDQDFHVAVQALTEAAAFGLDTSRTSVWLFASDRTRLRCVDLYERAHGSHVSQLELRTQDYPAYIRAVETRQVIAAVDIHQDPRTAEFSDNYASPLGIVSMLDAPIWFEGQVAGVICCEQVGIPRQWTIDEESFVSSIADFTRLLLESSDRKAAEQALAASEAKFRCLVEAASDLIYSIAPDGTLTYLSPQFTQILGYQLTEFVGKSLRLWVHPADVEICLAELDRIIGTGKAQKGMEFRALRQDGTEIWLLSSNAPIWNAQGCVIGMQGILRDITDRKAAAEALQRSEQNLRTLFDNAYDAIFIHQPDGTLLDVNARMLKMYGVSRSQALRFSIADDYSSRENPLECLPAYWQQALAGQQVQFEWKARRPVDGSCFDVEVVLQLVEFNDAPAVLATVRDISDRRAAAATLQRQEQFLRSIYNGVDYLIWVVDVRENGDLCHAGWNHQAELMTGIRSNEVVGKPMAAVFGPIEGARMSDRLMQCVVTGKAMTYEECLTFRQREKWFLTTISPLRDSEQRVHRIVGTVMETTDRKLAEAALQMSERKYRHLVETSQDLIWSADSAGRITFVNQATRQIYGYEPFELLGCAFSDFEPPEQIEKDLALLQQMSAGATSFQDERIQFAKDGRRLNLLFTAIVLRDETGQVIGTTGTATDITQRKQAEAQLREQTQQLEETLRTLQQTQAQLVQTEKMSSLGQLVAGVAHEINNPVSFIYGNLEHATHYMQDLLGLIECYQQHYPDPLPPVQTAATAIDLDFLVADLPKLT